MEKELMITEWELKTLMQYAVDGIEVDHIFSVFARTHDKSELLHTLKVSLVSAKTHYQNLEKIIEIQSSKIGKLRKTDLFKEIKEIQEGHQYDRD